MMEKSQLKDMGNTINCRSTGAMGVAITNRHTWRNSNRQLRSATYVEEFPKCGRLGSITFAGDGDFSVIWRYAPVIDQHERREWYEAGTKIKSLPHAIPMNPDFAELQGSACTQFFGSDPTVEDQVHRKP